MSISGYNTGWEFSNFMYKNVIYYLIILKLYLITLKNVLKIIINAR